MSDLSSRTTLYASLMDSLSMLVILAERDTRGDTETGGNLALGEGVSVEREKAHEKTSSSPRPEANLCTEPAFVRSSPSVSRDGRHTPWSCDSGRVRSAQVVRPCRSWKSVCTSICKLVVVELYCHLKSFLSGIPNERLSFTNRLFSVSFAAFRRMLHLLRFS